eukprot:gene8966-18554_t
MWFRTLPCLLKFVILVSMLLFHTVIVMAADKSPYHVEIGNAVERCMQTSNSSISKSVYGCVVCNLVSANFGEKSTMHKQVMSKIKSEKKAVNQRRILSSRKNSASSQQQLTNNEMYFTNVYAKKLWTSEGGGSGQGSDPAKALSAGYIIALIVYKYGILKFLDAPCGAVSESWTRYALNRIHNDINCFKYHGIDVVQPVIEKNTDTFKHEPWMSFTHLDISSKDSSLPMGYDIILSRDALQHLPYKDIAGVLSNYCKTDARYLLVGSYLDSSNSNKDLSQLEVSRGECFVINVLEDPFFFPVPLEIFAEKGLNTETNVKYLLLYRLQDVCSAQSTLQFANKYA